MDEQPGGLDGHIWATSIKEPGFFDCVLCGIMAYQERKQHQETCARMEPEDDIVIRHMCGAFVYNPTTACTCGAPKCKGRKDAS